VCLGSFHGGHSLLQSTRVRPKNDGATDNSRNRPNHYRRIEPDCSDDYCEDQSSCGSHGGFCNKDELPTTLYYIGELLNVGFDVQDLFVQVTVVIHAKSTLSSPDPRVQNEIKPIDFSLWWVATSVDRPAVPAQAASLMPAATPPDLMPSATTADASMYPKRLDGSVHPKQGLRERFSTPKAHSLAKVEFATIRLRLIKSGARVIETVSRIRPPSLPLAQRPLRISARRPSKRFRASCAGSVA
jgi:hypothetical protein